MIEEFAQSQLKYGRMNGGGLSVKTVNDILIVLGLVFECFSEEHSIALPRITFLREERRESRVLSPEEEQILSTYLIREIDNCKFSILLALYTGMRIGELCALQWSDITEEAIHVNKTLQRLRSEKGHTAVMISDPKSHSSNRKIPLPTFLKPYIDQFRQQEGYVLSNRTGSYYEPRLLQNKFRKIIKECGLEQVNFHALRHTFATRCIESGFDVKSLSEILGHSDVKTTLNRYVHSSFAFKQQNMQKLSPAMEKIV